MKGVGYLVSAFKEFNAVKKRTGTSKVEVGGEVTHVVVTKEELSEVLSEQLGIPHVWLRKGLVAKSFILYRSTCRHVLNTSGTKVKISRFLWKQQKRHWGSRFIRN